ncbi:FAD-dependent oxidoreductase [Candidatus Uhrbacteria bacterium]|nr:FAD-dependent oxidoreductase [Candidatus Uhrbacteria bacterium]
MTSRVVIIGGGFAGLSTAVHLSRHTKPGDNVEILLIDRQPEHVYLPLIYEVASGGLMEAGKEHSLKQGVSLTFDLDGYLTDYKNVRFRQGEVTDVDTEKKIIKLSSGADIKFDFLVMAMGAVSNTFGIDGVEKNAISLTSLDNALKIRKKCANLMTECERKLRPGVNMVVVGGGPNGVEVASEMAKALEDAKRECDVVCDWKITIVDAGPKILSHLNSMGSWIANRRLKKLGVTIAPGTFVKAVKPTTVLVERNAKLEHVSPFEKPTRIKSDLTIWAAGVASRPEWTAWGLPTDERGYIKALPTLQMFGTNHVFVAGDSASIIGRRMQQRAPEAMDQGKSVAENLIRVIRGQSILRAHHDRVWPFAIPLGGANAVSSFGPVTIFGIVGYALRKAIDLRYFLGVLPVTRAISVWWHGGRAYMKND